MKRELATGAMVRAIVVVSALAAVLATWRAAGRTLLVLDIVILLLAVVTALYPDSHIGLAVVAFVGVAWWATVDDISTPWSVAVAAAVAVLHAATAASSAIPPSAVLSWAVARRWSQRVLTMITASAGTWMVVIAFDRVEVAANAPLVTLALVVIAIGALALRSTQQPSG